MPNQKRISRVAVVRQKTTEEFSLESTCRLLEQTKRLRGKSLQDSLQPDEVFYGLKGPYSVWQQSSVEPEILRQVLPTRVERAYPQGVEPHDQIYFYEVLLLRRSSGTQSLIGQLEFTGGKQEGEEPMYAAAMESVEETTYDFSVHHTTFLGKFETPDRKRVIDLFLNQEPDVSRNEVLTYKSGEHDRVYWADPGQLQILAMSGVLTDDTCLLLETLHPKLEALEREYARSIGYWGPLPIPVMNAIEVEIDCFDF